MLEKNQNFTLIEIHASYLVLDLHKGQIKERRSYNSKRKAATNVQVTTTTNEPKKGCLQ